MVSIEEIIGLLKKKSGEDNITPNSDIFDDVGLIGDDFHEMIEEYAKKYSVDMKSYLWYFHTDEEGHGGLGQAFFTPPYKQVKRIPITPLMLTEFANKGKWDIIYPEHKSPKRRYDLLINTIIVYLSIVALITYFIHKLITG